MLLIPGIIRLGRSILPIELHIRFGLLTQSGGKDTTQKYPGFLEQLRVVLKKKEHFVKREIVINAPRQKVFDFLKLLKNQDKFNKWAKANPAFSSTGIICI